MSSTFVFKMKTATGAQTSKGLSISQLLTTRDHYITQAEYFWDNDQVKGMASIAFDGGFDEAVESGITEAALPSRLARSKCQSQGYRW